MTDPTSATCTGTYGGAATLPSVVSGEIEHYMLKYLKMFMICRDNMNLNSCVICNLQENVMVLLVQL